MTKLQENDSIISLECEACSPDAVVASEESIDAFISSNLGWDVKADVDYRYIERIYTFTNFQSAFDFAALVTKIAETNGHHPRLIIEFGKASISWWSHKISDINELDLSTTTKFREAHLRLNNAQLKLQDKRIIQ